MPRIAIVASADRPGQRRLAQELEHVVALERDEAERRHDDDRDERPEEAADERVDEALEDERPGDPRAAGRRAPS